MQKRIKSVGAIHESTVFRGSIVIDPYTPPFLSICAKRDAEGVVPYEICHFVTRYVCFANVKKEQAERLLFYILFLVVFFYEADFKIVFFFLVGNVDVNNVNSGSKLVFVLNVLRQNLNAEFKALFHNLV